MSHTCVLYFIHLFILFCRSIKSKYPEDESVKKLLTKLPIIRLCYSICLLNDEEISNSRLNLVIYFCFTS